MLTKKGLLYVSHTLSVFSTGYNLEQMLDGPVVYSGQHIVASCGDSVDLKGQFAWGPPPSHTHTHTHRSKYTHTHTNTHTYRSKYTHISHLFQLLVSAGLGSSAKRSQQN